MKRTTLISASLLLAFAGCTCGQGWRPNFLTRFNNRIHGVSNVGAPCDAGCHEAAPVATGCDNCATGSANYGGYDQIGDSYEVPTSGVTYSVAPPTYVNPTPPGGAPTGSRREPVQAISRIEHSHRQASVEWQCWQLHR